MEIRWIAAAVAAAGAGLQPAAAGRAGHERHRLPILARMEERRQLRGLPYPSRTRSFR